MQLRELAKLFTFFRKVACNSNNFHELGRVNSNRGNSQGYFPIWLQVVEPFVTFKSLGHSTPGVWAGLNRLKALFWSTDAPPIRNLLCEN